MKSVRGIRRIYPYKIHLPSKTMEGNNPFYSFLSKQIRFKSMIKLNLKCKGNWVNILIFIFIINIVFSIFANAQEKIGNHSNRIKSDVLKAWMDIGAKGYKAGMDKQG
ncbi:MAG: hypothetical protein AB7P49_18910, partial [Bdellovibrionales bacterium]